MKKIIRSKQVGQAGFADVITADLGWTRTAATLTQLATTITWSRLAELVELMIKCLLLVR